MNRGRGMPGRILADLTTAVGFLTRFPAAAGGSPGRLASAAGFFPLVGAAVGVIGGAVAEAALWVGLGPWLAAVFAVAAQLALTGALHEDGLADAADGFGGGRDRAAKLAIMRDSAAGSYAVLTVAVVLAARAGAVAALAPSGWLIAALAASGAASRAAMAVAMRWLPPARADGLAARAGKPGRPTLAVALALMAACAAPLGATGGGAVVAGAALGAASIGWLAMRQIGGATGDVFGAAQAVAEVAGLCALVIATAA